MILRRVVLLICVSIVFLFSFNAKTTDTISLHSMHLQELSHEWRFTFHLSEPVRYRTFFLQNPLRFVVDLRNVMNTSPLHHTELIDTPIKDIRYGPQADHVFRIVFDLRMNNVKTEVHVLPATSKHASRLQVIFKIPAETVSGFSWPHASSQNKPPKKSEVTRDGLENFHTMSKKKLRNIVIVIDPGHGGKDPGAIGKLGTREKYIVLAISKNLCSLINKQQGFQAILTRSRDRYISLRERLAIARKNNADMFIAVHADAWKNRQAQGVSVFALSTRGATSEAARWLAKRENQSELMGGVDLNDQSHLLRSVLLNLSQSATIRASLEIGYEVMKMARQVTTLHRPRVEQAAFVVLKSPDIPSLLIETGFISNSKEERRLGDVRYQQQLALSMMRGIRQYFVQHPPRFTWLAYWREARLLATR